MPLVSHEIVWRDDERLAFKFSMLNEGQVVFCQISDAALDELSGMKGTESNFRMAQFIFFVAHNRTNCLATFR